MKGVSDAKLEAGAVERADLGFSEQAVAVGQPDQAAEATFRPRVVRESENVQGRAAPDIQVPHRHRAWEGGWRQPIRELEIDREQGDVVSHAHFEIRSKSQVLDEFPGLDMHAGVELIRVGARPSLYSHSLGSSGSREDCERHR